jgi:hypothetical protein
LQKPQSLGKKNACAGGVRSGEPAKPLYDLTRISVTQTVSEQMTLESKLLRDCQPSFLKPFFEKWEMRGIMEKEMLKKHGGLPKGCVSFGLCDKQKVFALWFFGRNQGSP